jgi:hypothetical protein
MVHGSSFKAGNSNTKVMGTGGKLLCAMSNYTTGGYDFGYSI